MSDGHRIRVTVRGGKTSHMCANCRRRIARGELHRMIVYPPDAEIGRTAFLRLRECNDCGLRYGRTDLRS